MKSLSSNERTALRSVSLRSSPGHSNTMRSLERKGLVEHTSMGWRLTHEGRAALGDKA
jgi:Mn-dependent DtxR family transcriptional regulator